MTEHNDHMIEEVETRLDEIFKDVELPKETGKKGIPEKTLDPAENPGVSSPGDLKELVLSIEWEITDEVMSRFVEEVARQSELYRDDRVLVVFFKMLDSLGKYIWKYKAGANSGTVKVLSSVYAGLERIVTTGNLGNEQKEKILAAELIGFKKLRNDILKKKSHRKAKQTSQHMPEVLDRDRKVDESALETLKAMQENFAKLLEELKAFVHSEMDSLKKEMKRLLEERSNDDSASSTEPEGTNE
ncbi:MAG: hypothetical protein WAL98_17255 [Desulfatiglandaceae bacterium]